MLALGPTPSLGSSRASGGSCLLQKLGVEGLVSSLELTLSTPGNLAQYWVYAGFSRPWTNFRLPDAQNLLELGVHVWKEM